MSKKFKKSNHVDACDSVSENRANEDVILSLNEEITKLRHQNAGQKGRLVSMGNEIETLKSALAEEVTFRRDAELNCENLQKKLDCATESYEDIVQRMEAFRAASWWKRLFMSI